MMENDIFYNQHILQLAGNISHIGHLDAPDATAHAVSRLCGSKVSVELCFADGRVTDFAHQVEACILGQVASAVMAEKIIGSTAQELHDIAAQMRAMLKTSGPPPTGKWQDLALLAPVQAYPARHASPLLIFDAVEDCLHQLGV